MVRRVRRLLRGMVSAVVLASCAGQGTTRTAAEPGAASAAPSTSGGAAPSGSGAAPVSADAAPDGSCTEGSVVVKPSPESRTDGCNATFYCPGARTILVTCDGENDGTGTSLCDCEERGQRASVNGTVPGEAPDSCRAAAERCLRALPPPP
jgi:hypothetical protein